VYFHRNILVSGERFSPNIYRIYGMGLLRIFIPHVQKWREGMECPLELYLQFYTITALSRATRSIQWLCIQLLTRSVPQVWAHPHTAATITSNKGLWYMKQLC